MKREKPNTPEYKHNALFRDGPHAHFNACVGRNGGPYDFRAYAAGYFRAGERILDGLLDDSTSVDLIIYPLVYVYRQAIELSLKHLVVVLPPLWGETVKPKPTHRLMDNWTTVRSYLEKVEDFDPDKTLLPKVELVLSDFVAIDPTGEVFRFPESKDGLKHLQELACINVLVFGEAMHILKDAFEYFSDVQDALWDQHCEGREYDND